MPRMEDVIKLGTRAIQPSAAITAPGTLYFVTDELKIERSNGTIWEAYSGVSGGPASNAPITLGLYGVDGTDGEPGEMGFRGPAGSQGLQGVTGPAGDSRLVILPFELEEAEIPYIIPGAPGPTGATGAAGSPGAGSSWTTITKSVDQVKTADTTFAADTELKFSVSANTTYRFRARIYVAYHSSGFLQTKLTGPASPTWMGIHYNQLREGGGATFMENYVTTYLTFTNYSSGAAGILEFDGFLQNGVNAGTFALEWAQIVATGTGTVRKGSWIEYASV